MQTASHHDVKKRWFGRLLKSTDLEHTVHLMLASSDILLQFPTVWSHIGTDWLFSLTKDKVCILAAGRTTCTVFTNISKLICYGSFFEPICVADVFTSLVETITGGTAALGWCLQMQEDCDLKLCSDWSIGGAVRLGDERTLHCYFEMHVTDFWDGCCVKFTLLHRIKCL